MKYHAPNDINDLLDEVKRLRKRLAEAEHRADWMSSEHGDNLLARLAELKVHAEAGDMDMVLVYVRDLTNDTRHVLEGAGDE